MVFSGILGPFTVPINEKLTLHFRHNHSISVMFGESVAADQFSFKLLI